MKGKGLIQIVLAIVIVMLGIFVYNSIVTPMKFENEYITRRDACAVKLKAIRTLEDAYKQTYGTYCGNFDTLLTRVTQEDSFRVVRKDINYDKIPADVDINEMTESEAIKKGYITRVDVFVKPIDYLLENNKLPITDNDGRVRQMNMEEVLNLRYVPYPKGEKYEFELTAGQIEKSGFMVPVFECKVPLTKLLADLDKQQVVNKIAEIERVKDRYAGWKVGDMKNAVTDGNFE